MSIAFSSTALENMYRGESGLMKRVIKPRSAVTEMLYHP